MTNVTDRTRMLLLDLFSSEEGAAAVEYAILASAIAAVIVIAANQVGLSVVRMFSSTLSAWTGAGGP